MVRRADFVGAEPEDISTVEVKSVDLSAVQKDASLEPLIVREQHCVSDQTEIALDQPCYQRLEVLDAITLLVDDDWKASIRKAVTRMQTVAEVLPRQFKHDLPDFNQGYEQFIVDDYKLLKEARTRLINAFYNVIIADHGRIDLDDLGDEGFRYCKGPVFHDDIDGNVFKLQINDPEKILSTNTPWEAVFMQILRAVADFRASAHLFKCYLDISENLMVVSMDPGKHKELIVCLLLPNGETQMYYRHLNSAIDRQDSEGSRLEYLQLVLEKWTSYIGDAEGKGKDALLKGSSKLILNKVFDAMCLARSVKDMDLQRQNPLLLKRYFNRGVVNLDRFVPLVQQTSFVSRPDESYLTTLNARELEVLKECREQEVIRQDVVRNLCLLMEKQQEGIALNYKILDKMSLLQQMAGMVEEKQVGSRLRALPFLRVYRDLEILLEQMGAKVLNKNEEVNGLFERYALAVDQMALWASGDSDFSLNATEVFADFAKMFEAKSGIPCYEERMSMQELLRFMHYKLHLIHQCDVKVLLKELRQYTLPEEAGYMAIDLTDKQNMSDYPIWKIFNGLLDKLSDAKAMMCRDFGILPTRTSMWVAENSAGITIPTGYHYIEVQTYSEGQVNHENVILINFVDTKYGGSLDRRDMVSQILSDIGFDVYVKGMRIEARFTSASPEAWEKALEQSVRLMLGTKNIDIMPGYAKACKLAFERGVTNLLTTVINNEDMAYGQHDLDDILTEFFTKDEAQMAMYLETYLKRVPKYKKKEIIKEMKGQPIEKWKRLIDCVTFLKEEAQAKKDRNAQRRYQNLIHALAEEMKKIEP